jgi:hypothetical protein
VTSKLLIGKTDYRYEQDVLLPDDNDKATLSIRAGFFHLQRGIFTGITASYWQTLSS